MVEAINTTSELNLRLFFLLLIGQAALFSIKVYTDKMTGDLKKRVILTLRLLFVLGKKYLNIFFMLGESSGLKKMTTKTELWLWS